MEGWIWLINHYDRWICIALFSPLMTTAQYVKTSLTVKNIPIKDYNHIDNHIPLIYNII